MTRRLDGALIPERFASQGPTDAGWVVPIVARADLDEEPTTSILTAIAQVKWATCAIRYTSIVEQAGRPNGSEGTGADDTSAIQLEHGCGQLVVRRASRFPDDGRSFDVLGHHQRLVNQACQTLQNLMGRQWLPRAHRDRCFEVPACGECGQALE
jgi:hypothetical protein